MRFGDLHLFTGPMFAGKTESLVKEILFRTYFGEIDRDAVGIFKPAIDTRHEQDKIVSHNGATVSARPVSRACDIPRSGLLLAFFDEVQFFTAPGFEGDLLDVVRALRAEGTEVFCAGLDMDYMGRAFEVTAALMAEASHVQRFTATCARCGAPATRTVRHENMAERLLVGARGSYSPMCTEHWFEDQSARTGGDDS